MKKPINKVISQAKESFKLLEMLEKATLQKAKKLVQIPSKSDRKRLTNDKIVSSLHKMGLATQDEMDSLLLRIEKLESHFARMDSDSRAEELPS